MTDESTKPTMIHDAFIKKVMARPEVAIEFFSANLPKQILDCVDLLTLKQEKPDFVNQTIGRGIADFVFSVQWGQETGYITLLLEHQSKPDRLMAFRMQKYMLSICDAHLRKDKKANLPCIYPMILYSGKTSYTSPRAFWELFKEPKLAKQCFTDQIYLLELSAIKNLDLRNRYHSGIVLSLMREIHGDDILPHLHWLKPVLHVIGKENLHFLEDLLHYVLDAGESKNEESIIEVFAEAVSHQDKGKIMSIANTLKMKARKEGVEEGMEKGIEKGIERGVERVAKTMLASNMNINIISKTTKLSVKRIKNLKMQVC